MDPQLVIADGQAAPNQSLFSSPQRSGGREGRSMQRSSAATGRRGRWGTLEGSWQKENSGALPWIRPWPCPRCRMPAAGGTLWAEHLDMLDAVDTRPESGVRSRPSASSRRGDPATSSCGAGAGRCHHRGWGQFTQRGCGVSSVREGGCAQVATGPNGGRWLTLLVPQSTILFDRDGHLLLTGDTIMQPTGMVTRLTALLHLPCFLVAQPREGTESPGPVLQHRLGVHPAVGLGLPLPHLQEGVRRMQLSRDPEDRDSTPGVTDTLWEGLGGRWRWTSQMPLLAHTATLRTHWPLTFPSAPTNVLWPYWWALLFMLVNHCNQLPLPALRPAGSWVPAAPAPSADWRSWFPKAKTRAP